MPVLMIGERQRLQYIVHKLLYISKLRTKHNTTLGTIKVSFNYSVGSLTEFDDADQNYLRVEIIDNG
jgi:hypothetical protein